MNPSDLPRHLLPGEPGADEPVALMQRRLDRERAARKAAEALLTDKSRELYASLQTTREAERQLQLALWANDEGIWDWQRAGGPLVVRGLRVNGQAMDWPTAGVRTLLRQLHADERRAVLQELLRHARCALERVAQDPSAQDHVALDFRLRVGAGWRWLRIRGRAMQRDEAGRALRITGTVKDVTAQHAAEEGRRLMAHAFASTLDALVVVDGQWVVVQANAAFATLLGRPSAHLVGQNLALLIGLGAAGAGQQPRPWRGEVLFDAGLGNLALEVSVSHVAVQTGSAERHIVALRDISDRRRAQQALAEMAHTDSLTGLANRAAINQHLLARVQRPQALPFALMFIDLDGFKAVNDSHGHRSGDAVLLGVAERLRGVLPGQFIGRWGGDEFVVVLADGSDDYALRESAQLIIAAVGQPFVLDGDSMLVTPSIGAVFFPQDGSEAALLLQRADAAMYAAKARGRNGLALYEPALDDGAQRRSRLQGLLRSDAERNAFHFVLQPKVDGQQRTVGAEMLMRWTTEAFGPVSPAEFIPLAEQTGMIDLMGRNALHAAARLVAELRSQGCRASVAVNLSPQQLLRPDLERIVMRACEQHQADPSQIELELTESALVADLRQVQRLLVRLRKQGFQLALDDFGTGYSSLSHLRNLPFHKVKIDRSFVLDLAQDERARLMLDGVVRLCESLGLYTVAEGVETAEQFALLRAAGVDEFQGYLFAKPQPREQWLQALLGPPAPAA